MNDTHFSIDREKLESSMSRVFDASREDLWKAHTDPAMIEKWWGPRKYKTIVETLEARIGGKWKFINEADGERHVFFGVFRDMKEPEFITWTFNYEPFPNSEIVETVRFEEVEDGKTRVSTLSKYPNIEALEGMASGGMEEGARETWERLSELLTK